MDVENTFRVMFGIKKEQDMVELIEAAVSVAALSVPQKLKKHRSRIVKLLFDEDPGNATQELFSDDELGLDSDSDDDDDEFFKVTSTPKNTSHSPKIKKLGFKKTVKEESSPPPLPPLMIVGRKDKSMEATKKMLGRKYLREEEEAEKKTTAKKRKIDFPEPKKHCHNPSKAKLAGGYVRRLNATIKNIMS